MWRRSSKMGDYLRAIMRCQNVENFDVVTLIQNREAMSMYKRVNHVLSLHYM